MNFLLFLCVLTIPKSMPSWLNLCLCGVSLDVFICDMNFLATSLLQRLLVILDLCQETSAEWLCPVVLQRMLPELLIGKAIGSSPGNSAG